MEKGRRDKDKRRKKSRERVKTTRGMGKKEIGE